MTAFFTPLRYPGGKGKLGEFMKQLYRENNLIDGHYVEPYAGGSAIAFELLILDYVRHVYINDINKSVWAFWESVLNQTEQLCRLIQDTRVNIDVWKAQKEIQKRKSAVSILTLGFSTFFLNRTNRSGIITAGVIGGQSQSGHWKLNARYTKSELIRRIQLIARHANRISLSNSDALTLLKKISAKLPERSFIYLDPPYYSKGNDLYENHYQHADHVKVADTVTSKLDHPWVVSYDHVPEVKKLYRGYRYLSYTLSYSAQKRSRGGEVMFFGRGLKIPRIRGSMQAV